MGYDDETLRYFAQRDQEVKEWGAEENAARMRRKEAEESKRAAASMATLQKAKSKKRRWD